MGKEETPGLVSGLPPLMKEAEGKYSCHKPRKVWECQAPQELGRCKEGISPRASERI